MLRRAFLFLSSLFPVATLIKVDEPRKSMRLDAIQSLFDKYAIPRIKDYLYSNGYATTHAWIDVLPSPVCHGHVVCFIASVDGVTLWRCGAVFDSYNKSGEQLVGHFSTCTEMLGVLSVEFLEKNSIKKNVHVRY